MKLAWKGFIQKNKDGSENINYTLEGFPAYIQRGYILPDSPWGNVAHFHEDIEIITINCGQMGYNVNGKNFYLKEGDTLFINSGQIHYSFTTQEEECYYLLCIFHPKLLCSSYAVEEQFVLPLLQNGQFSFLQLKADTPINNRIRQSIRQSYEQLPNTLLIMKEFYEIWNLLFSYCTEHYDMHVSAKQDTSLDCIKNMMNYCRINYASPISLNDIARAGGVSNTYCNQLFHKYTNRTPIESLLRYRAEKAAELLLSSSLSMSEIAEKTGFSGASYFSEIFKKHFNVSPREYRKSRQ